LSYCAAIGELCHQPLSFAVAAAALAALWLMVMLVRRSARYHQGAGTGLRGRFHLWTRAAFLNMKYLRSNFPSRAGNGAPQSRQVISRKLVWGAASTLTIWYSAAQFGQKNVG
jgi:hypothetical protein